MHTAAEGELVVRKADDGRVAYASADAKAQAATTATFHRTISDGCSQEQKRGREAERREC